MARENWSDSVMWRPEQLYSSLKANSSSGVCHIIASGASLLDSMTKIRIGEDRVIGFNLAALADIRFDLYFFELATAQSTSQYPQQHLFSDAQAALILRHAVDRIGQLVLKDLWAKDYVNRAYFEKHYPQNTPILYDIPLRIAFSISVSNDKINRRIAQLLLSYDDEFVYQLSVTTTLAAIAVAAHAGFKDIVVHGFDFFGPHFYCDTSCVWPESITREARECIIQSSPKPGMPHVSIPSVRPLIPHIRQILESRHIRIFSASRKSPLSHMLPVYEVGK